MENPPLMSWVPRKHPNVMGIETTEYTQFHGHKEECLRETEVRPLLHSLGTVRN